MDTIDKCLPWILVPLIDSNRFIISFPWGKLYPFISRANTRMKPAFIVLGISIFTSVFIAILTNVIIPNQRKKK
jgi:hypothetical protein